MGTCHRGCSAKENLSTKQATCLTTVFSTSGRSALLTTKVCGTRHHVLLMKLTQWLQQHLGCGSEPQFQPPWCPWGSSHVDTPLSSISSSKRTGSSPHLRHSGPGLSLTPCVRGFSDAVTSFRVIPSFCFC